MKSNILVLGLALGATLMTSALAQSTDGVSPGVPDPRILSLHAKVDDLFKDGEVTRAYFIYRNELVPLGDKYAQYMVGYMHLTGLAVQQDRVMASAWYRLAAERGTPEFIQLRDQLLGELTVEQRASSDAMYGELRRQYCDLAVLMSSIKRLHSEVIIAREQARRDLAAANDYDQVRRDMRSQLRTLAKLGNFRKFETNPTMADLEEIERLVTARIEELSD